MAASKSSGKASVKTEIRHRSKKSRHGPDVYYEYDRDTAFTHPQYGSAKMCKPESDGIYKGDDDAVVSIDLTDPEDLMFKMEMLDLTDEETDELFQRAMDVNQELKQQLSHMGPSARSYATSAPVGLRSLKSDSSTSLPPIQGADRVIFPASRLLPSATQSSLPSASRPSSKSKVGITVAQILSIQSCINAFCIFNLVFCSNWHH